MDQRSQPRKRVIIHRNFGLHGRLRTNRSRVVKVPKIFKVSRATFTGMECHERPDTYNSFKRASPASRWNSAGSTKTGTRFTPVNLKSCRGALDLPDRRAHTINTDASANPHYPFGEGAIRRKDRLATVETAKKKRPHRKFNSVYPLI